MCFVTSYIDSARSSYCNTDYVFASGLKPITLKKVFFSYDVACQWEKKMPERFALLPEGLRIPPDVRIDAGVPKLHCRAHKFECQLIYSLNLIVGMGRTDGEGVERIWAFLNGCAASTKEMGPGHRHDTLDDHFHYMNWCKYVSFGEFALIDVFSTVLMIYVFGRSLAFEEAQAIPIREGAPV